MATRRESAVIGADLANEIASERPDDVRIENLSVELLAAEIGEKYPHVRYVHLDWGDQGPQHCFAGFLDRDRNPIADEEGDGIADDTDAATLVSNLRGVINDRGGFIAVNAYGGVYDLDLDHF